MLAAAFVLVPGLPLIPVIVGTQTLCARLLPVVLVFMVRLADDGTLIGRHTNGRVFSVLAYGTTAVLIVLTAALMLASAFGLGGSSRSCIVPVHSVPKGSNCRPNPWPKVESTHWARPWFHQLAIAWLSQTFGPQRMLAHR